MAMVASLAGTAAALAVPLVVRRLVQVLTTGGDVLGPVILMAAIALTGALLSSLAAFLFARCGEHMVLGIRERLVKHVLRLRLDAARTTGTGTLVAHVTSDTAQIRDVVDVAIAQLPSATVAVVATLVLMAVLDWVLLLITIGSFLVAAIVVAVVVVGVRRSVVEQQAAMGELAQRLTGALTSLPLLKAARAESSEGARVLGFARRSTNASIRAARMQTAVTPVLELAQQIALVGVVVAGGARLASGHLSAGNFSAFLLYLLQLVAPLLALGLGVSRIQIALGARARVEQALTLPVEDPGRAGPPPPDSGRGPAVELAGVSYSYGAEQVLDSVSLSAPRCGLTALIGASGAGKSTVLSLVERFTTPSAGTVHVLGHNVDDWPLDALRTRISYLDQSFLLVEGTVRDNLALGHEPAPSEEKMWDVLTQVGLTERVESLADGLDTELGRATDLSGGQRQRLAIARTLIAAGDVLLLDEPTSQLDSGNEDLLRQVVARAARTQAVIVVAHRMSTIRAADHIVVLEHGGVVAAGTHADLVQNSEAYGRLLAGQVPASPPRPDARSGASEDSVPGRHVPV